MRMSEKIHNREHGPQPFPTLEEVLHGIDAIIEGAEIKVLKQTEDEHGLFVFDIAATLSNGDTIECCFKRARTVGDDARYIPSRIHTTICDTDGIPSGTGPQYDFIDGAWVEIK
jgi:hypothetical protein